MAQYYDPLIVCPYYICDKKLSSTNNYKIACEPIDGVDDLQISFSSTQKRDEFKTRYCRKITKYRLCPIAFILEKKYEEPSTK